MCVAGLCSTPPPATVCGTNPFASDDGCGPDAVCLGYIIVNGASLTDRRCYSMPLCGQGDACPVAAAGAICNRGRLQSKDNLCVPGLCDDSASCPARWHCVRSAPSKPYGYCSDGAPGSVCAVNSDCHSQTCGTIAIGVLGSCR
jgi:hypothetical protein